MGLIESRCNGCGVAVKIGSDFEGHRIPLDPAIPVWAGVEWADGKRTPLVRTGLSMAEHVCQRGKNNA